MHGTGPVDSIKPQPVTLLERVAASGRYKRVVRELQEAQGLRPYHRRLVDACVAALASLDTASFSSLVLAAIVLKTNPYVTRQTVRQLELWAAKAYREGRVGEWDPRHAKDVDSFRHRYALLDRELLAGSGELGAEASTGIEVSEITWEEFAEHAATQ